MKRLNEIKYISVIIALFMLLVSFVVCGGVGGKVYAATSIETDVLSDLQRDKNFNIKVYPAIDTDNSIQVIQIAETSGGELIVYVYQPAANKTRLTATGLNMALSDSVNDNKYYGLTLLNQNGVFAKYRVNGVTAKSDTVRYYNITSIYRNYNANIDKAPAGDNTISQVACGVGQLFVAETTTDGVKYSLRSVETVLITQKYVGYCNYDDGVKVGWGVTAGATSAHFVAFSTNKPIDKLLSATLEFNVQSMKYKQCANITHLWHEKNSRFDYAYSDKVLHRLELKYTDKTTKLGKNNYSWNRIQTTSEFLQSTKGADLTYTETSEAEIRKTQYVFNFYESGLSANSDGIWLPLLTAQALPFVGDIEVKGERVSDVVILRLEFEKSGQLYNLGVVDNIQSGGENPSAATKFNLLKWLAEKIGIPEWAIIVILAVIALIIVLAILSPFVPILKDIFYWLWVIITSPFRLIVLIIKKIKGGDDSD